jgi:hypothetical protein
MRGFLGVTCHFLDDNWKVHSNLMTFCELHGPHTGENIGQKLLEEIKKMVPASKASALFIYFPL